HHALGVHRQHARQRLAAEAQVYVWIVLEHPEIVLGGPRESPLALGQREGVAGGILEVGDYVGQLWPHRIRPAQQAGERVRVDTVGLELDRVHTRAALTQ